MGEILIRELTAGDRASWQPLWDGYNAFYGRTGASALDPAITERTWARFLDPKAPMAALVAVADGQCVGIAHYLFHPSTSRADVCYLQDLFTVPERRGQGIGRALILAVYRQARETGSDRVYWQTHVTNAAGRQLYDQVGEHAGFIVYKKDF